ncbi:MAG: Tfp pilus assembly protein FimT/FimU [Phycisphaerales bacterium JB043]
MASRPDHFTRSARLRPVSWRAFTLFELLVVMGIIIALITALAPTLSGLLQSNRRANAVNTLTATLSRARSVAIEKNRPTGVVFLLDIQTRKTTMIITQLRAAANGKLQDSYLPPPLHSDLATDAFVMEPAENIATVELPEDVLVYGLSFHHELESIGIDPLEWYYPDSNDRPYFPPYFGEVFQHPDNSDWHVNPWVLPHNDPRLFLDQEQDLDQSIFRNPEQVDLDEYWTLVDQQNSVDGILIDTADVHQTLLSAHSFVIVFGADGLLKPVISTGTGSSMVNYYLEFPNRPLDAEPIDDDAVNLPYDLSSTNDIQINFNPVSLGAGANLIVNVPSPNPEVMLRPANMLAVVELNEFRRGTATMGQSITEPWELHASTAMAPWPQFRGTPETLASPLDADHQDLDELMLMASDWIDLNGTIIAFDPNVGTPQRRSVN